MFPHALRNAPALALANLLLAATAFGQSSGRPLSDVGGYAGNELRSIYRSSIGQGYTSQSLRGIDLQASRDRVPYVGQSFGPGSLSGGASTSSTLAPQRSSKPFSNITSTPTVSPYMNLFREDLDGFGDLNYHTLVRPQLQQLQTNQRLQNENVELNRRVQSISAQRDYSNPAGAENQYPTGHTTVFRQHGRYYPTMNIRRQKR